MISFVLVQGYARCDNHLFHATPLGLGLVEGYDALNFDMSQPTLRAHMEVNHATQERGREREQR